MTALPALREGRRKLAACEATQRRMSWSLLSLSPEGLWTRIQCPNKNPNPGLNDLKIVLSPRTSSYNNPIDTHGDAWIIDIGGNRVLAIIYSRIERIETYPFAPFSFSTTLHITPLQILN